MCRAVLLVLLLASAAVHGFLLRQPGPPPRKAPALAFEVPLIPALIGSTALVFAVFNIPDNKIDLTDEGMWKAKQKRRQERIASGQFNPEAAVGKDPYRYRIPLIDEDDEDLEMIQGGGKKKGGGCG